MIRAHATITAITLVACTYGWVHGLAFALTVLVLLLCVREKPRRVRPRAVWSRGRMRRDVKSFGASRI